MKKVNLNKNSVLYKKYLKMDHRPTYEMRNYESPKDNIGENLGDMGRGDEYLDTTPSHSTWREHFKI